MSKLLNCILIIYSFTFFDNANACSSSDNSCAGIDNASEPELSTHLQEEFFIEQVKINIHNFCTPILDQCESWIVLQNDNNIIKKEIFHAGTEQLSKNEIIKQGNFIYIPSWTGGNCIDCDGINVFSLNNNFNISYIGYFNRIEANYLVGYYSNLETNEITSHADAPVWNIYYNFNDKDNSLIMDFKKTCEPKNTDFSKNKKQLNDEIKKIKINKKNKESNIYVLLLNIMSFYKWCGYTKEYIQIASMLKNIYIFLDYDKMQKLNKMLNETKEGDYSSSLKTITEN